MALTQLTDDLGIISQLPDEPNTTLSAAELKAAFDQAALTIKNYINNTLLPELENNIGLFDDITALDDSALSNNSDRVPVSSVVKAALSLASAAKLTNAITLALSGGATGSVETDFSTDPTMTVSELNAAYLTGTVSVSHGGTGANTAVAARSALGISNFVYPQFSVYITYSNSFNPNGVFTGAWTNIGTIAIADTAYSPLNVWLRTT